MSTFTGQTKSADVTLTPKLKTGAGWQYDQPEVTYDGSTATIEGDERSVFYDSFGTTPVFVGQAKSADVTLTPQAKS